MKRLSAIITFVSICTAFSSFGQGYFQFQTGKSQVWDGFSSFASQLSSTVDVAFLWGAQGAVPQVAAIANGVPSTATTINVTWTASAAWTAILNDPNFTFAVNSGAGNSLASALCTTAGGINYNGGIAFAGPLATSPGSTYTLFMIGWDATYATPALAQASNAAVGWSQTFNYTATAFTASPNSMTGLTPAFGVVGIPEPATLALAGLGGVAFLLLRRRK